MARPLRRIYINSGLIAGFVATCVMALLLTAMQALGVETDFDLAGLMANLLERGRPAGWTLVFIIWTVFFGTLFAILQPWLPGRTIMQRGVFFGVLAWLATMVVLMPVAGAGLFGAALGWAAPVAGFVLHAIYGAVLGIVYGALPLPQGAERNPTRYP